MNDDHGDIVKLGSIARVPVQACFYLFDKTGGRWGGFFKKGQKTLFGKQTVIRREGFGYPVRITDQGIANVHVSLLFHKLHLRQHADYRAGGIEFLPNPGTADN